MFLNMGNCSSGVDRASISGVEDGIAARTLFDAFLVKIDADEAVMVVDTVSSWLCGDEDAIWLRRRSLAETTFVFVLFIGLTTNCSVSVPLPVGYS